MMADNAWAPPSTGGNAWASAAKSGDADNAWSSAAKRSNVWGNAAGAIGSAASAVLSPIGKALDYQRAGLQEHIFHGGSSDENRRRLRSKLGIESDYESGGNSLVQHLGRGAFDTALDTLSDPLTYETFGLGAGAKLAGKALDAAHNLLPAAAKQNIAIVQDAAQDAFTHGGKAKRAVGQEAYDTAMGAAARNASIADEHEKALNKEFDAIRASVPADDDWADVLRLRNAELPQGNVGPHVLKAAAAVKALTDKLHALQGPGVPYRQHYIPGLGQAMAVSPNKKKLTYNLLDAPFNAHAQQRQQIVVDPAKLAEHTDAFKGAIQSATRQQSARDLAAELHAYFGSRVPQEVRELFERESPATGSARTSSEAAGDLWKGIVSLPKAAIVGTSPRHMFNIADLLAQKSVRAVPEALGTTARLLRHPDQRAAILSEGIDLGAISPSSERNTPVIDWLSKLGAPGKLASKPMQLMNDATWAFDDAAVQALAKRYAKSGRAGYSAGRQARRDLVDYENVSPFTQQAKKVMPFATFNTQVPGVVLRGILQNPARAALMNRATGGMYYGSKLPLPGGAQVGVNNPTSEVGQADPVAFLRKSLADPVRNGLDLAGISAKGKRDYFTYGHDIHKPKEAGMLLLNMALGGVPGARTALEQGGLGLFHPRNWLLDLLQGNTGVNIRDSQ